MRISFDFDDTLSTKKGQKLAAQKIAENNEVWIITARQSKDSAEVLKIADELGIPHSRVVFTNGKDKWSFVMRHKIDVHYDNNQEQIDKINANTLAKGVLFVNN